MLLGAIFERFVEQSPVTVMVRGILERILSKESLDELFEKTAKTGYTRELLFSTLVNLMSVVVCSIRPSVGAVYKAMSEEIGVSKTAVYDKLKGIEPQVSAALVEYTANELMAVIHKLGGELPELLPGYRALILDGNQLGGTEHRLKVLGSTSAAALPGKSLVVLDPALMLAVRVFPCEDGHAQERALFHDVLATVAAKDLYIADRNMCTLPFLFGLAKKQAAFIIRSHQNLPWNPCEQIHSLGRIESGELFEQNVLLAYEGQQLILRRVLLKLDQPTRNGDTEIALFTNLTVAVAAAEVVTQLYRQRWTLETVFQVITETFHCEIKTLGYPRAALFSFCMAMLAYNVLSCVRAALRSVHGTGKIEAGISNYYLADEIEGTYRGMMIAIPPSEWQIFHQMTLEQVCVTLKELASKVRLEAFSSSPRKPKKKKPKPPYDPKHPHVSTARLLAQAKRKDSP